MASTVTESTGKNKEHDDKGRKDIRTTAKETLLFTMKILSNNIICGSRQKASQ
jgi:hypothetical protein